MQKKPSQAQLLPSHVTTVGEQQQEIIRRLGLEALPTHETRWLPLARILVPDEKNVRVPKSLVQSVQQFGVLQAPSVVRCSPAEEPEEQAMYEVIAGRRRTRAARLAGLTVLKVEDYAYSTPQLSALLALMENTQRSAAWVKEVADLRVLIHERVGMTIKELVACGFVRTGLTERLKIAQLPTPLLDQIVAGKVPLETARKLVRLTQDQLKRVIQASQDEPLTAGLVKQALRAQINPSLSSVQDVFPSWETLSDPQMLQPSGSSSPSPDDLSLDQVLATLRAFTQSDAYQHAEETHVLVQALIQRLDVARREQEQVVSHLLAS